MLQADENVERPTKHLGELDEVCLELAWVILPGGLAVHREARAPPRRLVGERNHRGGAAPSGARRLDVGEGLDVREKPCPLRWVAHAQADPQRATRAGVAQRVLVLHKVPAVVDGAGREPAEWHDDAPQRVGWGASREAGDRRAAAARASCVHRGSSVHTTGGGPNWRPATPRGGTSWGDGGGASGVQDRGGFDCRPARQSGLCSGGSYIRLQPPSPAIAASGTYGCRLTCESSSISPTYRQAYGRRRGKRKARGASLGQRGAWLFCVVVSVLGHLYGGGARGVAFDDEYGIRISNVHGAATLE
eukprot:scaffold12248_cov66-Phaeocystis_antarctica.AAC.4